MLKRFFAVVNSRPLYGLAWGLLSWIVPFVCIASFGGVSAVGLLAQMSNMIVAVFASIVAGVLFSHYYRREGKTRHCARCGYQRAPQGEQALRCPECGADWTTPRGVVEGQRTGKPWMLRWGVLLCVIAGAAVVLPIAFPKAHVRGWGLRVLPTSTLIGVVVMEAGFDDDAWAELRTRTLSTAQERRLAEGLLDKRMRKRFFSEGDERWMVGRLRSGALPGALVARYYHEMFKVRIVGPAASRVGETFRVSAGCEDHGNLHGVMSGAGVGFMYVSGFFASESNETLERQEKGAILSLLDDPRHAVAADIRGTRPGPLRIRLVGWIVVAPFAAGIRRVTWQDDGSPVIPAAAEWSERFEVEHVVQVRD